MKRLSDFVSAVSRFSLTGRCGKNRISNRVHFVMILSICIFLGLTTSFQALGQTLSTEPITGPVLRPVIKPEIQKTITKIPIPFKPFTLQELHLKDPKTGLAATEKTLITIPPLPKMPETRTNRGNPYRPPAFAKPRVMMAGDIVRELNVLEPQYNRLGYTLRDRTTVDRIGGVVSNKNLLNDQKRRLLESKGKDMKIAGTIKYSAPQAQYFSSLGLLPQVVLDYMNPDKPMGINTFVPYQKVDYRTFQGGDPDTFQCTLNTGYTLLGAEKTMKLRGTGKVDVSLLGQYVDLFSLDVTGMVPTIDKNANSSTQTIVKVLGIDLSFALVDMGLNNSGQLINIPIKKWVKNVDKQAETTIQVGPVPVVLRVGIGGDVGLSTQLTLSSANASMTASVTPFTDAYIWAEAGVGTSGVCDAGIGGNLVLLFNTLAIEAGVFANKDPAGALQSFQIGFRGTNYLNMLAGSLFVYVNVYGKEFRYDVFEWEGLQDQSELFNYPLAMYYPNKDKILTVQLRGISRGNEGGFCSPFQLVSREGHGVLVEVWERGSSPDINKLDDIYDIRMGYSYRNGVVAGFLWSQTLTLTSDLDIPVASSQSPYVVRIALVESDNCAMTSTSNFSSAGVVDIAPAGNKVLMLAYDGNQHMFKGWGGSPPPYLTDYTPRGVVVTPKTDNPSSISFSLRDQFMR